MIKMDSSKKELRREMAGRLQQLPLAAQQRKSLAVCQQLLSLPVYQQAKRLMAFLNMPEEVSLDALIDRAIADGKEVYVPLCRDKTQMDAVRLDNLNAAVEGMYGIRTAPAGSPCIEPAALDLVLVPGVAFDRHGHRLGHGAAYYDRFLAKSGNAPAVAAAFSEQTVDFVPIDAHDVSMSALVTDTEYLTF